MKKINDINMIIDSIKGPITKEQCLTLYNLAKKCSYDNYIVEIGSYRGRSTCCLGIGSLHGNQSKLLAIDLWESESNIKREGKFLDINNFDIFLENVKKVNIYPDLLTYIKGNSIEVSKQWNSNKKIEILFIDGEHTYEAVKQDYKHWSPFMIANGLVLFHDYSKHYPGIMQFVDENNKKEFDVINQVQSLIVAEKL